MARVAFWAIQVLRGYRLLAMKNWVFGVEIGNKITAILAVPRLHAMEIDPQAAAQVYQTIWFSADQEMPVETK
jgi:hypothetical protein